MDNRYVLASEPNYVLRLICKKQQLDPIDALTQAISAANPEIPSEIKVPSSKWVKVKRLQHKHTSTKSITRMGSYKLGMMDMQEELVRLNTREHFAVQEAEAKLDRPNDLTIRQLSYFAKLTNRNFMGLLKAIEKGLSPEKPQNWRTLLALEKIDHDETKAELEQARDEIIVAENRTEQLLEILNRNGIQDIEIQDP